MGIRIGAIKNETLQTVFVNYPKNINTVCELLRDNYTKITKIEELLNLGDIYSLGKNVNDTIFYHRDKDDPFNLCESIKEKCTCLDEIDVFRSPVDYYLIWTNKWNIYKLNESNWASITKFLKQTK